MQIGGLPLRAFNESSVSNQSNSTYVNALVEFEAGIPEFRFRGRWGGGCGVGRDGAEVTAGGNCTQSASTLN